MGLLLQLNGDLPERFTGHERKLYIFACRRKACRRKNDSIRALRGIRTAKATAKAAPKQEKGPTDNSHNGEASTSTSSNSQHQNLGQSLFSPVSSSAVDSSQNPFSSTAHSPANPFSPPTKDYPSQRPVHDNWHRPLANPFTPHSQGLHSPFSPATPKDSNPESDKTSPTAKDSAPSFGSGGPNAQDLSTTFAEKARISLSPKAEPAPKEPWPEQSSLPKAYPSFYLDADYESLDPIPSSSSASKQAMNIYSETGSGKDEDRDAFESTIDKTFQRFADRLAQNPLQVLRYEFGGMPLLYSDSDAIGKALSPASSQAPVNSKVTTVSNTNGLNIPRCSNCNSPRVFELQLVPQAIAELEVEEEGLEGMEWGTVILGVCGADCGERGVPEGEYGWVEEWVGVQWEEAASKPVKA